MQRHVRYLVVEDDAAWSQAIVRAIQTYFADECRFADRAIRGDSAYDGAKRSIEIVSCSMTAASSCGVNAASRS